VLAAGDTPPPAAAFPKTPRERLAVTSYPFRALIDAPGNKARKPDLPGMDIRQFPAFIARQFAVFNVNPLLAHFASTDDAYLASFRQALRDAGSHIVDLGLGDGYFYDPDAAARSRAVASARQSLDIAAELGSPSVRQHLGLHRGQKPDAGYASGSLALLAEYGAKQRVVINLENDNAEAENAFVLADIIQRVKNPNSLIGHDAAYNERAVRAMLPHAWNMCHVKNAVQDDNGRIQRVDVGAMLKLANAYSYAGYFSMEFDTDIGDPMAGTKELIEETLSGLS
jgi:sugar phosphate isomerase/epimerase